MHLRTVIASLAALALLAPTGAAEPLIDQLDNGDFEEFEDEEPVEWRVLDGEVTPTSEAHEGDSAVQLNTVGDALLTAIAQNVSLEREDVPTVPNATYELDFASYLNTGTDTPSTSAPDARAKVLWKNALGEVTDVDVVPIDDTDGYVEHNVTLEAPLDATEAEIQFHLERTSSTARTDANLKVDDAAFGPALP